MNRRRIIFLALGVLLPGVCVAAVIFHAKWTAERQLAREVTLAQRESERIRAQVVLFSELKIAPGLNFTDCLQRMGVDAGAAASVADAAQRAYNLRQVRAGKLLAVGRSVVGELRAVRYQIDTDRMLWVLPRDQGFHAEVKVIPSETAVLGVSGEVRDSLFNAVTDAGEGPELALRLAEIFGYDLDFYTDPRSGDTFRVILEKKRYLDGQMAAYGRILAAEYNNAGRSYEAVLFDDGTGRAAYYTPDGKSLAKAFLRSPLKFAAPITSRFSRSRYHPILKIHRPHLGIDYGAPVGTPVQAIGSGRVAFAGYQGGAGKLVHIKHTNGYETFYMHLSRVLVRPGHSVAQGQRIGLVGRTGLATGPHLDFRIRQHGAYRNFEALRLPRARSISAPDWTKFASERDRWLTLLRDTNPVQAQAQTAAQLEPTTTGP